MCLIAVSNTEIVILKKVVLSELDIYALTSMVEKKSMQKIKLEGHTKKWHKPVFLGVGKIVLEYKKKKGGGVKFGPQRPYLNVF